MWNRLAIWTRASRDGTLVFLLTDLLEGNSGSDSGGSRIAHYSASSKSLTAPTTLSKVITIAIAR